MLDSINNIVLLLGIAQGLFLAALLRQRHWKLYANRFLVAMMATYGIILLNLLLQDIGFHETHPKLWLLLSGLPLVTGPLHYLYARHLIHPERRWRRGDHRPWVFASSVRRRIPRSRCSCSGTRAGSRVY